MPQSLFAGTMADVANQRIFATNAFTPPPPSTPGRPWFSISNPGGLNGYEDTQDNVVGHDFDAVRLFDNPFTPDPRPLIQPYIALGKAVIYSTKPPASNVAANYATLRANLESLGGQIYATVNHEPENDTPADQFAANYTAFYNAMHGAPNISVGPIYMLGTMTSNGAQAAYRPFIDTMPLDWLGVDGYNPLNRRTFSNMFNVWAVKARSRNVPWLIAEWSTHGTPTERATHVQQARVYWEDPDNADLLIVSWFDSDGGPRAGPSGWRIDTALPDGWVVVNNIAQAASPPPDTVPDLLTPPAIFDALQTPRRPLGPVAPPPPPPVPLQRGAVPIGEADYPIPPGALFVAPGGSDGAGGLQGTPKATIQGAANALPAAGGTIVVRGGDYPLETFLPHGKPVTIQNYPGEAVWLVGSDVVTGWNQDNTGPGGIPRWKRGSWVTNFLHTADDTIDPSFPLAPYPEQVWINDVPLEQVGSLAEVDDTAPNEPGAPGTFWYDSANDRLWIGTTPFGKTVRVAVRQVAIQCATTPSTNPPKTIIRGIGWKHYATSNNLRGAVSVFGDGSILENCWGIGNSGAAVFFNQVANPVLRLCTFEQNGQFGYRAFRCPYILVEQNRVVRNNRKRFASYGAAGGGKIDNDSIGLKVWNNYGEANYGHCFWVDAFSHYPSLVGNECLNNNLGAGIFVELSDGGLVAGNWVKGSIHGILVASAGSAAVWNNTLIDNTNPLIFAMDSRSDSRLYTARNNLISQRVSYSPQTILTAQDSLGPNSRDIAGMQWTVDNNAVWMKFAQNYAKVVLTVGTSATYTTQAAFLAATTDIDEATVVTSGGSVDPYLNSDDRSPKPAVTGTGIQPPQSVIDALVAAGVWTSARISLPTNIGAF